MNLGLIDAPGRRQGVATGGEMASLIDRARKIWTNLAGSGGARTHTRYAYLGDYTALVATHADLRLLIDTRDRGSAPQLALVGRWEADVERVLIRLIRPGMRIVEVGANFGYHTLTMARAVGPHRPRRRLRSESAHL